MASQLLLFPNLTVKFPSTRYQGSKAKLVDWIWEHVQNLPFLTCLDPFFWRAARGLLFIHGG